MLVFLDVTLTAVSDWLRLSVWPIHCLGSMARRCFSEVMSFWDLESFLICVVTDRNKFSTDLLNPLKWPSSCNLLGLPPHWLSLRGGGVGGTTEILLLRRNTRKMG